MLNYTYVDSSVLYYLSSGTATTPATQIHDQFLNVSPHSVNATLYYEDQKLVRPRLGGLSRRVPDRPALQVGSAGRQRQLRDDQHRRFASYKLTDHLKLTFDALNITNQEADQWSGKQRRAQRVFSTTGRQFFLGASYTF
ncbi:hypothetical protein ACRAWD_03175 [Caulobacter segnis]